MKQHTPKPGDKDYDVSDTSNLNTPKFRSATEQRQSHELPADEHINDESKALKQQKQNPDEEQAKDLSLDSDLGNDRPEGEEEKEKIIRR